MDDRVGAVDPFNQTRIEDNPGAHQALGDLSDNFPSDISIDLDHQAEPSNASDYDEEKERLKILEEQDAAQGKDD